MSHGHDAAELAFPLSLASAPITVTFSSHEFKTQTGKMLSTAIGAGASGEERGAMGLGG